VNQQLSSLLLLVSIFWLAKGPKISAAEVNIQPYDLRCEYLTDPLGIDAVKPRFGWKQLRGQKQTAYQVLVSSSKELLATNQGDLWDSGKISSSQSTLVPYAGSKLISNQDCHWKVRILDKDGKLSPWSEPARFSMGLLEASDWKSAWFHHPDAEVKQHVWFRRNIELADIPSSAFLHVASLGYHQLYVNGVHVDPQSFGPALTRLDKRVLYMTHDLRNLLKLGKNTIALWQGPGWANYNYFKTRPALRVQLNAKSASGKTVTFSPRENTTPIGTLSVSMTVSGRRR
jgi:alpha-L-rhamnosidase